MSIQLSELIQRLREELTAAMISGSAEALRFQLGPVELELTMNLEKEAKPGAKVRFWVVEAGTEGRLATKNTQRIKLVLEPVATERNGEISKVTISGDSHYGER